MPLGTLFLADGRNEDISCLFYDVIDWMNDALNNEEHKYASSCQQIDVNLCSFPDLRLSLVHMCVVSLSVCACVCVCMCVCHCL